MRVLVTGGRNYADCVLVWSTLQDLCEIAAMRGETFTVIEGGCPTGADYLAREWSYRHGSRSHRITAVELIDEPADWTDLSHKDARIKTRRDGSKYDANAGPRRNQKMIDVHKPDCCVAFPGGSGTADCIRRANKAGIEVIKVGW